MKIDSESVDEVKELLFLYRKGFSAKKQIKQWLIISGVIFDATNSYQLAILNGIMWNLINILIVSSLLFLGTGKPIIRKTA